MPYLAVPTAPIDERDIAAVGVRALRDPSHAGAEYVLTGPQSLTHSEQISTIASVLGRDLRIEELTPDEARRELLTIGPLPAVNMLLDAWSAALGHPAHITSTFTEITGAPQSPSAPGSPTTPTRSVLPRTKRVGRVWSGQKPHIRFPDQQDQCHSALVNSLNEDFRDDD